MITSPLVPCQLRPLVLLDRDGTIIQEVNYLSAKEDLVLLSGAVLGLGLLRRAGLSVAVISNQSGVGRGLFSEATLIGIHEHLNAILAKEGIAIDGIYYCTHRPEQNCTCRKPKSRLALKAAVDLNGDLRRSFMVGDRPCDIELGRNIGARTILVRTGYGHSYDFNVSVTPDHVAADLEEAAVWILENLQQ